MNQTPDRIRRRNSRTRTMVIDIGNPDGNNNSVPDKQGQQENCAGLNNLPSMPCNTQDIQALQSFGFQDAPMSTALHHVETLSNALLQSHSNCENQRQPMQTGYSDTFEAYNRPDKLGNHDSMHGRFSRPSSSNSCTGKSKLFEKIQAYERMSMPPVANIDTVVKDKDSDRTYNFKTLMSFFQAIEVKDPRESVAGIIKKFKINQEEPEPTESEKVAKSLRNHSLHSKLENNIYIKQNTTLPDFSPFYSDPKHINRTDRRPRRNSTGSLMDEQNDK